MKKCRDSLNEPLFILWSKSIETGKMSELFRTAHVTPILKQGCTKCIPTGYRPVRLTSHIDKTFEKNSEKVFTKISRIPHEDNTVTTRLQREKVMLKPFFGAL